jgi:hypothetical protein
MKIAILFKEKNHYSFLYELINRLPSDKLVELYTNNNYHNAEFNDITIIKNKYSVLKLALNCYKYDKIIIDEIYNIQIFFLPLLILKRKNTLLVIHNLKSWFKPNHPNTVKNLLVTLFRRFLIILFKNYIVVSNELKIWGQKHYSKGNFYFIPFGFHIYPNIKYQELKNEKTRIAVPGMISNRRKYENIIKLTKDEIINKYFHFVILGKPSDDYGENVLSHLKHLPNVTSFEDFIPINTFYHELIKCDLLFSDFNIQYTTMFEQEEIYGETKATGISFLMLAFQKPGILPINFKGMSEMDSQTIRFSDFNDLKDKLLQLNNNKYLLEQLKINAINNKNIIASKIDSLW